MMRTALRRLSYVFVAAFPAACASVSTPTAPPVAAVETPPPPAFQVSQIMGARPGEIDALLGAPALVRREGQGEFRRYSLAQCVLITIIYPGEDGVARVAHADVAALSTDEEKPAIDDCLAAGL